MKYYTSKWQVLIRILIVIVAVGLIARGIYNWSRYFHDSKMEMRPVTAQIVKDPRDGNNQLLEYQFDGKTHKVTAADKFLKHYGDVGDEKNIYVQIKNPRRAFINSTPRRIAQSGSLLIGWGMLLAVIVYAERKIIEIMKNISKINSVSEEEQ